MKVKFFTEGGRGIGIGHLTRCLSLCQAFEEKGGECHFVVKGDEKVKGIVKQNLKLLDWVNDFHIYEQELEGADVVVIDSYMATLKHYFLACEKAKGSLFIDDFLRLEYPCGVVLNGSVYVQELNYPHKDSVEYLLGTRYIPLRKSFWEVEEKPIKDKVENILITFGGDDSRDMTPKVLMLLDKHFPHLKKLVVVGPEFRNRENVYSFYSENVIIYENIQAEQMKNLMMQSDIAISAGGQTTYELARVGLPSVLVAVADNQLMNCMGWSKTGFAKYAGWWEDDKIFDNIVKAIKELMDINVRLSISEIGRSLVDGQGGRRVADLIKRNLTHERE